MIPYLGYGASVPVTAYCLLQPPGLRLKLYGPSYPSRTQTQAIWPILSLQYPHSSSPCVHNPYAQGDYFCDYLRRYLHIALVAVILNTNIVFIGSSEAQPLSCERSVGQAPRRHLTYSRICSNHPANSKTCVSNYDGRQWTSSDIIALGWRTEICLTSEDQFGLDIE